MYFSNCSKQHITHKNILTVFFIVFLSRNSFQQSLWTVVLSCSCRYHGSHPLTKQRDIHFCEPDEPILVFFNYRIPEKSARKAWLKLKSVVSHHTQVFNSHKNPPSGQNLLTCTGFVSPLSCAYRLQFYHLRICSHGLVCIDKQT